MSVATDPIRDQRELKALANYFLKRGELRNYCLVVLGAHTALRVSDLLGLTWEDVYDFTRGRFRDHLVVIERKTGKTRCIALNREAVHALSVYYPRHKGKYIFSKAWRIVRAAADELRLTGHIGCHSLRKTWGYNAWSRAKIRPEVIMIIYNHSSFAVTRRYLGITQDDLDLAYSRVHMF